MIFGAQPRVAVPQVAQALLPALSASLKKCRNSRAPQGPKGISQGWNPWKRARGKFDPYGVEDLAYPCP